MNNQEVAKLLLDKEAVLLNTINPFTWSSGIKSPIYCDNRVLLSYADARNIIIDNMVEVVKSLDVDAVLGTATAGISWAAIVADRLNLPHGYVRSSSKGHGRGNQIEGDIKAGSKVVVIEDLISTGGSVNTVIEALDSSNIDTIKVISIFTYNLVDKLVNDVEYTSLTNIEQLIEVASNSGLIDNNQGEEIRNFITSIKK